MLYKDFLATINKCPFCEGKNRTIVDAPTAYLTYALAPYHKHHLLILPKRHVERLQDLTDQEQKDIEQLERQGMTLLKKLGYKSIALLMREGEVSANKSVAHVHYHLIPEVRVGNLDEDSGLERKVLSDEEVQQTMDDFKPYL